MEKISVLAIALFAAICVMPYCSGLAFGLNGAAANAATGQVCITLLPGANEPQTMCIQCAFANRFQCVNLLASQNQFTIVCSSNTTNSTIPTGTCVFCPVNSNQIAICTGMAVTAAMITITDTQFFCLERNCIAAVEATYQGLAVAQKNKVLNFPLFGGETTTFGGIGKRDVSSEDSSSKPVFYKEYLKVPIVEAKRIIATIDEY